MTLRSTAPTIPSSAAAIAAVDPRPRSIEPCARSSRSALAAVTGHRRRRVRRRDASPRRPATGPAFARGLAPGGTVVTPDGSFDPNGPRPGGLALDGGLAIDGTVTAVDADSITLKLADGQEMTFKTDAATTYHEAADASSSDVAVGDDVSVKVTGGRVVPGGSSGETPELSARDVTVSR